ncbi:MAG: aminotransferase class V-fold PLP-dependent enzyme [Deltaproteobacteria bacterium]|nr:aminotransferase class V-fold PLP-dependent enzyme [Deltaproteobacteria bacterium]
MTAPRDALAALRSRTNGDQLVHLNNAGVAPLLPRGLTAARAALELMLGGSATVLGAFTRHDRAREVVGHLVGAPRDDVAFFSSCSAALSQVAFGMRLGADDEIVLPDQEYPSNAYPWHRAARRAGARVVVVPSRADWSLDHERLLAAVTPKTRVVAVSWIEFSTGAAADLRALADAAHRVGAWLVVDAIQGLGVIPFEMAASGADVVCGGAHKWLCGPLGLGFMVANADVRNALEPLLVSATTFGTPDDPVDAAKEPRRDRRRFEPGNPLVVTAAGAAGSVEHLFEVGINVVHAEALGLRSLVVEEALRRGFEVRPGGGPVQSPIVTFVPDVDPTKLVEGLREHGVSVAPRGGGVRVAPHAHNTVADVERLFALVDELRVGLRSA